MEFKTDFLAEDYSELCWYQAKVVSTIMSLLLAMAIAFTVFGIVKMPIVGIALLAIFFPVIYVARKRGIINRAERRFGAYGASSELSLEIDDDEIRQSAASGETRLPWEDVYAVRESENCYYVFLSKRKAFYFPKRSFKSEEQVNELFSYIRKHVPEKKIKIKK